LSKKLKGASWPGDIGMPSRNCRTRWKDGKRSLCEGGRVCITERENRGSGGVAGKARVPSMREITEV
jgi:hypothetical protein